ncbi:hypothetical protein K1T71_000302 [Dendrolimus kikuchii]|uniref:Uncharacterized protein n=1 Tax=Dendrolimus kikuchii TaxID=765133 RepID=A0ACC1DJH8_9NEOP|nr:hypothetical protein K1T71_000302 [Dendrolimus kikuchii]
MHKLWVLAFAFGVASGDIGLHHKLPETSYGVPSYQISGPSYPESPSVGYNYKQPVNNFFEHTSSGEIGSIASGGFGISSPHSNRFQNGVASNEQKIPSFISTTGGTIQNQGQFASKFGQSGQYSSGSNIFSSSSAQKYQNYYIQQQPAEIYRHFYIHSAPEELEQPKPRRPIILPPPQKHYKIIFVKAPTESRAPQIVPVAPQNEEKTIVYVLVKKPEEQEVILPKIEQKPPAKPEVYYIKYNEKQDSQAVIDNIVNDFNKANILTESDYLKPTSDSSHSHSLGDHHHHHHDQSHANGVLGPHVVTGQQSQQTISSTYGSPSIGGYSPPSHVTSSSIGTSLSQHSASHFPSHLTTGPISTGELSDGSLLTGGLPAGSITSRPPPVITFSPALSTTTASSLANDYTNTISTSQGVPHETYGPPKFRTK